MKVRSSLILQFVLLVIAIALSALMSPHMPDVVPTHWNSAGHVDGYGSKWINLLLMPGTIIFCMALTPLLPFLSPKQFKIEPFESTYGYVMVLLSGLILALHIVILRASTGRAIDLNSDFLIVMFGFFALIGNVLGKVGRNFWMGVRTPWTLADERVWKATHRFAGRLWVGGGIVGVIACLIGLPFWLSFAFVTIIAFLPVIRSYSIYRSLNS
jgi:uncharacterized membrane protein